MTTDQPSNAGGGDELDDRFPSGPWIGFYRQGSIQARQRLNLTFRNGSISGTGSDPVGNFSVRGAYDISGKVTMAKLYATHRVDYRGHASNDGIPGAWTILTGAGLPDQGRFHIWPDTLAMGEARTREAEQPQPAAAIEPAPAHA